jgi:hypothetical protein
MTYVWSDKGVKRVTALSKAVRDAMSLKGGAEFQSQKVLNRAAGIWSKEILRTTDIGSARIRLVACTGIKCDLIMDSTRWGWECMLQLQEVEDRKTPAATTWAAEFLLREGASTEFLGLWITSGVIHEAKRRRATQVITCSVPCGKWLHMIGARASPGCELCKRERQHRKETIDNIPAETVAHIQRAVCKAQKKSIIGAHNRCWKYLLGAISKLGEAKRDVKFIGDDKDRQLESLWRETRIGDVLAWEMLRMKRKGYLIFTRLAEMLHTKITKMERRKTTKK